EGKGRGRRFYPAAVDVFRQLRQESGRGGRKPGRPPGSGRGRAAAADTSGLAQRIRASEKSQQDIEKRFRGLFHSPQKLRTCSYRSDRSFASSPVSIRGGAFSFPCQMIPAEDRQGDGAAVAPAQAQAPLPLRDRTDPRAAEASRRLPIGGQSKQEDVVLSPSQ